MLSLEEAPQLNDERGGIEWVVTRASGRGEHSQRPARLATIIYTGTIKDLW